MRNKSKQMILTLTILILLHSNLINCISQYKVQNITTNTSTITIIAKYTTNNTN